MAKLFKFIFAIIVSTLLILVIVPVSNHDSQIQDTSYKWLENLRILTDEEDLYISDPITGFTHRTHARRHIDWPEHPRGSIDMTTNNLGFRQDKETTIEKDPHTVRVLVVGDSHMTGVLYNYENFAYGLQHKMQIDQQSSSIEVLNASTGYFGPQHYLATLKKHLVLKPDIFIVIVFSGNDFSDALKMIPEFETIQKPDEYMQRLKQAKDIDGNAIAQGLNQIYYYKHFPQMKDKSLLQIYDQFQQIKNLCDANNIRLFLLSFPTILETEDSSESSKLSKTISKLGLNKDDLSVTAKLRDSLGKWAQNKNVDYWDSTTEFQSANKKLFWNRDYHLNIAGHELLVEEFYKRYQKQIAVRLQE